ncbi:MAG: hypothetical protein JWO87_3583 [Phycisphaerales bacterium]|jgi:uncharacterized membrane protein YqaE (UPF0057 family)|nr:hypothetical protein [Phycisphaerales bacterium]MDB5305718.1 hypothetical protein [Phycisphaerales bacterium]
MRTMYMPWMDGNTYGPRDDHAGLKALAVLMPPAAVVRCSVPRQVPLSIFLTFCGWFPGVMHARRIVARHIKHNGFTNDRMIAALRNHVRR